MNKLKEIIFLNCPNGVVYKTLGELEDSGELLLGRGKIISKQEMIENPGNYPVYSSSATNDGEIGKYGKYMFDDERITWSIDGGGKLFYRNNLKYSVTNVGGYIKVLSNDISTKFLYYVLIEQWQEKKYDYVKKAHPSVIRQDYFVPILPMEVQEYIVNVLDKFSEIIVSLKNELELRKKQFNYYKDKVTMLGDSKEYNLEDVCTIIDCPHSSPKWKLEGIPVIRNYNLVDGNIDMSNLSYVSEEDYLTRIKRIKPQASDILFSREAPIGNVGIIPENFVCCQGQRVVLLRANEEKIIPRYLLHVLQGNYVRNQINQVEKVGSTVSNFNISDLKKLKLYVPSLDMQIDITKKLDTFSDFCSKPDAALLGEINLRIKQYEYYRKKLLNFEEMRSND